MFNNLKMLNGLSKELDEFGGIFGLMESMKEAEKKLENFICFDKTKLDIENSSFLSFFFDYPDYSIDTIICENKSINISCVEDFFNFLLSDFINRYDFSFSAIYEGDLYFHALRLCRKTKESNQSSDPEEQQD